MRRWIRGLSASAAAACLLAGITGLPGAQAAPSTPQAPQASTADQHVIVLLKNQHPEAPAGRATIGHRHQLVAADQARLVDQARGTGGRDLRQLNVVNAFAATVPASEAAQLAADPAVAEVVPDRLIHVPASQREKPVTGPAPGAVSTAPCPSDPAHPQLEPEALQLTNTASGDPKVPAAQDIATGKAVTVAFLAEGLDINNPDFIRPDGSHVITDYQDFTGEGADAPTVGVEAFGDASSIAAQGRQSYDLANVVNPAHPLPPGCTIRILGMAPGANLVAMKVIPANGFASVSAIAAALDWSVSHDHANVISESLGSNPFPDTGDDVMSVLNEQLVAAGVTVLASSGDSGPANTIGAPASSPGVISVGATTSFRAYAQTSSAGFQLSNGRYRDNGISAFSSAGVTQGGGRTVDLVAPGDEGWAVCNPDTDRFFNCTDFTGQGSPIQLFGGTSEAAPLVAGAAALVIQAYRDSHNGVTPTPDLVRRLLTSTAADLGMPANEQGAGLLDTLRAVQAARAVPVAAPGTTVSSDALLTSKQQLDLSTTKASATSQETVTNLSDKPRTVQAAVRSTDVLLSSANLDVHLDAAAPSRFVDQSGVTRAYTTSTFTVPVGATRAAASIAWPATDGSVVRIVLLQPDGTFAGFSFPQSVGSNFGSLDVPSPVAGQWKVILWTRADAGGFTGTVHLSTASYGIGMAGTVSPASFTLAAHQSQTVTVQANAPRTPGDGVPSLVFSTSTKQITSVPVVVRSLVDLSTGHATVTGSFAGGNGRASIPSPEQTYGFDVPSGSRDLSVGLNVTGDPNQELYGFLVDPSGEALSVRTNQRPDGSLVSGMQLSAVNPRAGRWMFVFMVFGPVSGNTVGTPYTASFALNAARASATGLPNSTATTLPAGRPVTATVSFTNTGVAGAAYFVDGRLTTSGTLPLVVRNPDVELDGIVGFGPFPTATAPTRSDSLTMSAQADQNVNFDMSAISADHLADLAVGGDPDRVAGPVGHSPTVTINTPNVASMPWVALPSPIGPFAGTGPTAHLAFTGSVHTRLFDRTVSSSTGDPLLSDVDATAPASSPVTVAAGANGTITVTLTPTGAVGTVVRGVLYLDTIDAVTGSTDEVTALPYAYTVG